MTTEERLWALRTVPLPQGCEREFADYIGTGYLEVPGEEGPFRGITNFFRVRLLIRTGKGSAVKTEVWLPEDWNGRLIGEGNGGIAGRLSYGTLWACEAKGFACFHTDMGTSSGTLCGWHFPQITYDFGSLATHLSTVCAKILVRACYGRDAHHCYFEGNSTGGLQGFSEAQRYPEDYDGILAGVPAFNNLSYHTAMLWNYTCLHGADRKPLFTKEELKTLNTLSYAFLKDHGGVFGDDPFVSDPYPYKDVVKDFLVYLNTASAFSEEQKNALRKVYEGPANPKTGERICCGYPLGIERDLGAFKGENCPGIYQFLWEFGPDFDPYEFDFSADFDRFRSGVGSRVSALGTDLRSFRDRGGKLLSCSGTADTCCLHEEIRAYYEKAAEVVGGAEECMKFFRYYILPGRAHSGGPGADYLNNENPDAPQPLDSLIRWVEEGEAPDAMLACGVPNAAYPEKKPFRRVIYPYGSEKNPFRPLAETYTGTHD